MVKLISLIALATAAQALASAGSYESVVTKVSSTQKVSSAPISKFQQSSARSLQGKESSSEVIASKTAASAPKKSLLSYIWNEQTKLGFYLAVWYLGNVGYNIYNKKACNALGKDSHGHANAHWTLSAAQVRYGQLKYYNYQVFLN